MVGILLHGDFSVREVVRMGILHGGIYVGENDSVKIRARVFPITEWDNMPEDFILDSCNLINLTSLCYFYIELKKYTQPENQK